MSSIETIELESPDYVSTDPDVRLMLRVRDDDASAFEELVVRYQTRLITLLWRLIQDRDKAEELAQDVFLRVYRARSSYVPTAKFSTWLFTIAHNVASNALRSLARRREVNITPDSSDAATAKPLDNMASAPSGLMPTRQVAKAELAEVVRAAVDSLNERQRMALLLARFEHMSYAEIGETMELSVQAVKSLLSRARENLRILLGPYMREDVQS